jgi:hypothetical protein
VGGTKKSRELDGASRRRQAPLNTKRRGGIISYVTPVRLGQDSSLLLCKLRRKLAIHGEFQKRTHMALMNSPSKSKSPTRVEGSQSALDAHMAGERHCGSRLPRMRHIGSTHAAISNPSLRHARVH